AGGPMKLAQRFGGRLPERTRPRLEDRYRDIIAHLCAGKSFIDVGCLWAIHGEYAFYAAENGSPRVVGFDVNEATPEFHARNTALGNRVGFIRGDLNAPSFPVQVGTFDIVFCVSVLHHMPNPVAALLQLRRVCGEAAIIGVPTIPERDLPHSAIYLPFLDPTERQKVLKALSTSVYRTGKRPARARRGWRASMGPRSRPPSTSRATPPRPRCSRPRNARRSAACSPTSGGSGAGSTWRVIASVSASTSISRRRFRSRWRPCA